MNNIKKEAVSKQKLGRPSFLLVLEILIFYMCFNCDTIW